MDILIFVLVSPLIILYVIFQYKINKLKRKNSILTDKFNRYTLLEESVEVAVRLTTRSLINLDINKYTKARILDRLHLVNHSVNTVLNTMYNTYNGNAVSNLIQYALNPLPYVEEVAEGEEKTAQEGD